MSTIPPGNFVKPPRQLVVFFDGTWNEFTSRTNVRRLFETTAAQQRPDILCHYDQGVGTGSLGSDGVSTRKIVGGAFGLGFRKNIQEAMAFLTEHYQPGDEISIFGFSRGAYTGLVLSTMIGHAGIPALSSIPGESSDSRQQRAEALAKSFHLAIERAEAEAYRAGNDQIGRRPLSTTHLEKWDHQPAAEARAWRKAHWDSLRPALEELNPEGYRPGVAVLGLWDPVEAMSYGISDTVKSNLSNTRKAEYERHRGHQRHSIALGPHVRECYVACSLDERRQVFMAEFPDACFGKPRTYEFVWFVGDHSDVGGGHENKDLAGFSMNWMLDRVGGRLLGPSSGFHVHSDATAPRHDLSVGGFFEAFGKKRVRGEIFTFPDVGIPIDDKGREFFEMTPVRSKGWTMKIHASVLERMRSGTDWFALEDKEPTPSEPGTTRHGYVPRPFRNGDAAENTEGRGWVDHDWTEGEIRKTFEIVP